MFTPRNVSQLLVADTNATTAYNAAGTAAAKKATLDTVGKYAIIANPFPVPVGSSITYIVNESVSLIVKTAGGFKVSEAISAGTLDSFKGSTLAVGVNAKKTLTYPVGDAQANKTYGVTLNVHDNIGSMLNDRFLNAYVVTDANGAFLKADGTLGTATLTAILVELASLLQATCDQSQEGYTITSTATTVVIEQLAIGHKVGFIDGIANPFDAKGQITDEGVNGGFFNSLPAVLTDSQAFRADDLVQLKNLEWFNSGYDKDAYRDISYPASFDVDSNVVGAGIAIGDSLGIYQFHKDRDATNVERQHRQLVVAGAGFDAINTALAATDTTAA